MRPAERLAAAALLATFCWLAVPDLKSSPAVLWPSLLAVGLALITRDIVLSLLLGAFSGTLLLHGGHPWLAFQDLLTGRLVAALTDRWNVCVLVFTLMMGGFVGILHHNGGMRGLAELIVMRSRSRRRAGLGAYCMGWLIFFDGLANSMLVGKTVRPIADRAGMSREKLALIVDCTSSPIAGLALLSTWVAYEMSVIRQGLENTGDVRLVETIEPFTWLVVSLPFRFYNWFVLLIVFLAVWMMRDWGPMIEAERAVRERTPNDAEPVIETEAGSHLSLALAPLAVLVIGIVVGLFVSGQGLASPLTFGSLVRAFGAADTAGVFVLATALASIVAIAWGTLYHQIAGRSLSAAAGGEAFVRGMQEMFPPALTLVLAWTLNSVIKELETARYLVLLLGEHMPAEWLPSFVFLLSSLISFSTGTSWGTMAIVTPLIVPLAVSLTQFQAGMTESPVLIATVGAVLAGSVFGDHCSPISDTTIVSALSSGCDVVAHVRTQLPYALAAALLAVVAGYLPAGYGIAPFWLLAAGGLACWASVRFGGTCV